MISLACRGEICTWSEFSEGWTWAISHRIFLATGLVLGSSGLAYMAWPVPPSVFESPYSRISGFSAANFCIRLDRRYESLVKFNLAMRTSEMEILQGLLEK